MAGITRQINGKLAQSKTKGDAFRKELHAALSPEAIAKTMPEKQSVKPAGK